MIKRIVIPGEEIKARVKDHVYERNGKFYSKVYGVLIEDKGVGRIVPLKGHYVPRKGDIVIGVIEEIKYGGCLVDINTAESAFLPTEREYEQGDLISAEVDSINEVKEARLTNDRKLFGGALVEVDPVKIPRIIGKNNSMIDMIREKTGTKIVVGRNGRIWIKGEETSKAAEAIDMIVKHTHATGLTETIKNFLEGESR